MNQKKLAAIKKFITSTYTLKSITRYNNLSRVLNESVAEHSFFVALIVIKLFECYDFNLLKSLSMATVHDLPEIYITDMPHNVKSSFPDLALILASAESAVVQKKFSGTIRKSLKSLSKDKKSVEVYIVELADILSCIQYSEKEISLGNSTESMHLVLKESNKRIEEVLIALKTLKAVRKNSRSK